MAPSATGPCTRSHSSISSSVLPLPLAVSCWESWKNRPRSRSRDTGKRRTVTPWSVLTPGAWSFRQVRWSMAQVVITSTS